MYSVNGGDKSTVSHWVQVLRDVKCSSMTYIALINQEQSLGCCFNMLMNTSEQQMITTRNIKTESSVSMGSASNITDALGYSTVCTRVGSTKLNYNNCAKRGADVCSPVMRLTKSFLSWLHHYELHKRHSLE